MLLEDDAVAERVVLNPLDVPRLVVLKVQGLEEVLGVGRVVVVGEFLLSRALLVGVVPLKADSPRCS
eukprot:2153991-Alexandrium_andersonii.AAC.1